MSVLLTHAVIPACKGEQTYNFNPEGLHPFDKMKFVLEQAIYWDYLHRVCGNTTSVNDLKNSVAYYRRTLKNNIFDRDVVLNTLYSIGYSAIDKLLNEKDYYSIKLVDLESIFSRKALTDNDDIYQSSMQYEFLVEHYAIATRKWDTNKYPTGIMLECALYVPSIKLISKKQGNTKYPYTATINHEVAKVLNDSICITLEPKTMSSFNFNELTKHRNMCPHCIMQAFDMHEISLDEYVALLACFSLDHNKYIMNVHDTDYSVADVCFDLVTGSSYTALLGSAGMDLVIKDLEPWLTFIKNMISSGKLKSSKDNELFGELLAKLGEDSKIVNYFTKPLNQITATEALSFRNSFFSDFISDRLAIGMEDIDQSSEDDSSNDEADKSADSETPEVNTSIDGATDGDLVTEKVPEEDINIKPQIDPGKMLLELAKSADSMSDYIYRETVSRRISSILKNPPENAMPNDLLMLKRWRSRWLYLASISCLRDFLTRVSLRLSNV